MKRKVAVVGKGLTFDSGGYNLKAGPGSMIELMKFDMGGSAATLGAAKAIALLQPEGVEAHFIVAACENMVSAEAMRPGDILTASNGKTIEVINTDAEGRLTLADALVYAEAQGAEEIVDIATLTGACIVSLGNAYAGLWAGDEQLADALKASFKATGEKVWQMPLVAPPPPPLAPYYSDTLRPSPRTNRTRRVPLVKWNLYKDRPLQNGCGAAWSPRRLDCAGADPMP